MSEYAGDDLFDDEGESFYDEPESVPVFYKGAEVGEAFYDEEDETLIHFTLDDHIAKQLNRGSLKGFSINSFR